MYLGYSSAENSSSMTQDVSAREAGSGVVGVSHLKRSGSEDSSSSDSDDCGGVRTANGQIGQADSSAAPAKPKKAPSKLDFGIRISNLIIFIHILEHYQID